MFSKNKIKYYGIYAFKKPRPILNHCAELAENKNERTFWKGFQSDDEVVITSGDTLKAALTPETSKLSQPESLGLSFYVNHINSGDLDMDQMKEEINNLKWKSPRPEPGSNLKDIVMIKCLFKFKERTKTLMFL